MKKLLGALVATSFVAGSAFAADMPMKAQLYKAPPPAPVYSWTGFYIGGDIGGFGAHQSATTTAGPPGFGAPAIPGAGFNGIGILPTSHGLDKTGVLGGGHVGYNWQTAPNWLLGVEGDFMWYNRSATNTQTTFDTFGATRPDGNMTISTKSNDYLASIRGRLGWVAGSWMLYGTGGVAWTNMSSNATWTPIPGALSPAPSTGSVSFDGNRTGYAAGGGIEWMLSSNWLLRAEYLHYGFSGSAGTVPFIVPSNGCTPVGTCSWAAKTSNLNVDTGRVGLSYKF
jgi:outer membrane immunogenic protein